jgi:hypothetical protein
LKTQEREGHRKTIAWGMPDVSGASAVNTDAHPHDYHYARIRLRVHWAPGIPRALFSKGDRISRQSSGAARREAAKACHAV